MRFSASTGMFFIASHNTSLKCMLISPSPVLVTPNTTVRRYRNSVTRFFESFFNYCHISLTFLSVHLWQDKKPNIAHYFKSWLHNSIYFLIQLFPPRHFSSNCYDGICLLAFVMSFRIFLKYLLLILVDVKRRTHVCFLASLLSHVFLGLTEYHVQSCICLASVFKP